MRRLAVDNLVKYYRKRKVVDQVSLEVESGSVVGLLGPNGAGKTTTFYMTVGMIRPEGGKVFLDDDDITDYPMHVRAQKGVGYLPQEKSVYKKLTVLENILIILEALNIRKNERKTKALALLHELGIHRLADNKADQLSGGQRRRLEITRTLATNPGFILLDEPFAGVDPLAVMDIKKIIGHLKQKKIGILISDHNVRETLKACDRAYILNEGKVIESGSPQKIAESETARKFYLGEEFTL